jgi:hypothetical protein
LDSVLEAVSSRTERPYRTPYQTLPTRATCPSCFKGLNTGELKRYWLQNSPETFQEILTKFIDRRVQRGQNLSSLSPILLQAAANLDRKHIIPAAPPSDTLYLHWPFHPNGLTRQDVRRLYDNTLRPTLDYDNMQIATSRPKNLNDILTGSALAVTDYPLLKDILSRCIEQQLTSRTS